MGMIKRALKRTTRKLFSKIVPPNQSQQLVLNPSLQAGDIIASSTDPTSKRKLASLQRKFKRNSKDTTVAEALLLAVKNHLPPVQFHHVHGPNVQLSKNKCVARRTQSFCQALVFSNRVILPNERVYIKVLEIAKGWSGTIRFGFTAVDPATLACRMPKHACPDMTNAGHTWARALADEVVRRNSVIHFSYNKNGLIHYGINNQDCGVFHANVSTNQNLWLIVDIYGLTAAVELIDPRVHNALGEFDSRLDLSGGSTTMYKSTSAMNEIFGQYDTSGGASSLANSRSRKKASRKHAARQAAALAAQQQSNWAFQNPIGANFLGLSYDPQTQQYTPTGMQLPNLNSMSLPSAQQNIYSPMPSELAAAASAHPSRRPTDAHDYHQIMNNTCPGALYQAMPSRRTNSRLVPSVSVANIAMPPTNGPATTLASTSSSSFSSSSGNVNSSSATCDDEERHDLSRRLENLRLTERRSRNHHQQLQQQSTPRSSRSTSLAARTPVAGARRRLESSTQTNHKRTPDSGAADKSATRAVDTSRRSSKVLLSSLIAQSSSSAKPRTSSSGTSRHSSKGQKSSGAAAAAAAASDRDKSNNSPPSKDCPICFERPINCVLYQCGHMCTCYECGVKQWKTESRTCPICRTIIKDVIKTYMS